MELLGFQRCTKCGRYLPFSSFAKDRNKALGLFRYCKECSRKACKSYYKKHKREMQKRNTAYCQKFRRQPMTAWKNKIRTETRQLILQGLILHPGCCEHCGVVAAEETIHVHHLSYVRPDKVLFLCKSCHQAWHNENPNPPEPDADWVEKWYEEYQSYPREEE